MLALAYGYAGLAEEGSRQLEIATRLSPRDFTQAANLSVEGLCHLIARRYDEAIVAEGALSSSDPTTAPPGARSPQQQASRAT